MKKIWLLISFAFFIQYAASQEIKIQQKEGIFQNREEKHIVFRDFNKFESNSNSGIISSITKLIIFDDLVYILDGRQSKILVFDIKANYSFSIGRPGQGPGDLEHPSDFFITENKNIYVLNPMAKRIEVFSIKGNYIKRIELILPKEVFSARPNNIIVDKNYNILIAYNLSPNLIDIYDDSGKYLKTLLRREDELTIPGVNIGNCSQILLLPREKSILHFNYFTGLFTKISETGKVERRFSVFDELQNKEVSKTENQISESKKANNKSGVSIKDFQLWSRICLDKDQNIYVFLLLKKQTEKQKMFVFSSSGDFLYWENIPFFVNKIVDDLYCFEDSFVFKDQDDNIFLTKKGG